MSYRLLDVARRPPPRRRKMLPRLPLDAALEIVAAGGFVVARDPVPLLPHAAGAGACLLSFLGRVEGAEVPHDQSLHQQHREGCDQGGARAAGQPACARAADHLHTGAGGAGGAPARLDDGGEWMCREVEEAEEVAEEEEEEGGWALWWRRRGEREGHRVVRVHRRRCRRCRAEMRERKFNPSHEESLG